MKVPPRRLLPGVTAAVLCFLLGACDLILWYTEMQPLIIRSVDLPTIQTPELKLSFSRNMKKSSAEAAILLSARERLVPGRFSWPSPDTVYYRLEEIIPETEYTLIIAREAEDKQGNSLTRMYRKTFQPRAGGLLFKLIQPAGEEEIPLGGPSPPLLFDFDAPVDIASLLSSSSVEPELPGLWSAGEDPRRIAFVPSLPFLPGVAYSVRFSPLLRATDGSTLEDGTVRIFRRSGEEPLRVEKIEGAACGTVLKEEETTRGIEKETEFLLTLSRPGNTGELTGLASFSPEVPFDAVWNPSMESASILPKHHLQWDTEYQLRVPGKEYRFRVDGEGSRPISLGEVYYAADGTGKAPVLLQMNDHLELSDCDPARFLIYLSHSFLSDISLFSFLDHTVIRTTNGAAGILFLSADRNPEGIPRPPGLGETVFVLTARISVNHRPGLLILSIGSGIADSRGNGPAYPLEMHINIDG